MRQTCAVRPFPQALGRGEQKDSVFFMGSPFLQVKRTAYPVPREVNVSIKTDETLLHGRAQETLGRRFYCSYKLYLLCVLLEYKEGMCMGLA